MAIAKLRLKFTSEAGLLGLALAFAGFVVFSVAAFEASFGLVRGLIWIGFSGSENLSNSRIILVVAPLAFAFCLSAALHFWWVEQISRKWVRRHGLAVSNALLTLPLVNFIWVSWRLSTSDRPTQPSSQH